jgi:diacylglycerol kinase (ATP)
MRVAFLSNPRSGRGISRWAAHAIPAALRQSRHDVPEVAVGDPPDRLAHALDGAEAFVIAGGDGTVHRAAPEAMRASVPVYHIPCGNENLFARQFGMTRSIDLLLGALQRPRPMRIDVAKVQEDGRPSDTLIMLVMCSTGPDAGVIRRLTALRTRAIGHLAYVEPVIREWLAPSIAPVTVETDGRRILDGREGALIVANSRQYALRIDPAVRASMTDGLLDVVFLPGKRPWSMLAWALRCRLRRPIERAGGVYATGREVRISSDRPAPYQVDGDSPGWHGAGLEIDPAAAAPLALTVSVCPLALSVLCP